MNDSSFDETKSSKDFLKTEIMGTADRFFEEWNKFERDTVLSIDILMHRIYAAFEKS